MFRFGALLTAAFIGFLAMSSPSFAFDGKGPAVKGRGKGKGVHHEMSPEARFKKLDLNGDGKISLDEAKAHAAKSKRPGNAEAWLKKRDTNGDGSITVEELKAFLQARHEKRVAKKK